MRTECPNCKTQVQKGWNFCPECGIMLKAYEDGEIATLNDLTTINIMDTPKSGGISIYVDSHDTENPEIRVSAFGDFKKYEPELKRRMGVYNDQAKRMPAVIEEPESVLKRRRNRITIRARMPETDEKNIRVDKYENSIEIKGYTGNKLYYTSFEVPNNSEIMSKKLTKDIFTLILRV
jgi:hypothetical protein